MEPAPKKKIRKNPITRESIRKLYGLLHTADGKLRAVLDAMDLDEWDGVIAFDGGKIGDNCIPKINRWASDVTDLYQEVDKIKPATTAQKKGTKGTPPRGK